MTNNLIYLDASDVRSLYTIVHSLGVHVASFRCNTIVRAEYDQLVIATSLILTMRA